MDELPMSNRQVVVLGLKFVQSLLKPLHFRRFLASFIAGDIISGSGARLGTMNRPGFRGGSNSREWSHEEVPEVFTRGA
jgi:hypothetical protein